MIEGQREKKVNMKQRVYFVALAILLVSLVTGLTAQSFPYTATVSWDANNTDAVTSYAIQLDNNTPVNVAITACDATTCKTTFQVPDSNQHTLKVTATNQWGTSSPTGVTFRVSVPAPSTNIKVTK
jgi:uncharacterized membrane protein